MKKIYLVMGASSDVGALLIERLLAGGEEDIVVAQGNTHLDALVPLVQQYPGRVRTFSIDLTKPGAMPLFLTSVEHTVGVPTHLVHLPALRVVNQKFKKFDEERFAADMQVQLGSALALCKHFLPKMAKNKFGRVLFMLSSYVLGMPPKNTTAYVVAKEALYGLAKSLAADYAGDGITVNCVAPSMIETKFLEDTPHLIVQAAAEAHPMGRNATPEDVVPAMQFLLSDEARFISGVVLPITGGA